MRFIPHAILIALVLILPLAVSILLALSAFTAYTFYVWYAFHLYVPSALLTVPEAAGLALKDVSKLLSWNA